jgi:TRAP-type C4-dicarboxylate transport system permease small subunit
MTGASEEGRRAVQRDPLAALTRPLAIAGGLVSIVIALVVTVHVCLRWVFNSAVPGDIELVQIGTAVTIFAFFPFCQSRRGNIMVDTFTTHLPPRMRDRLDALWDLVFSGMMVIIAWRLCIGAYDAARSHTVSMILELPTGWAIAFCALSAALLAAVAAATALRLLRTGS